MRKLLKNPIVYAWLRKAMWIVNSIRTSVILPKRQTLLKVRYIYDRQDWVIHSIGKIIEKYMQTKDIDFALTTSPALLVNCVIHFGSVWTYTSRPTDLIHSSNRIVVTVFHGNYGITTAMDQGIETLRKRIKKVDAIIVSTRIMESRLKEWGICDNKIFYIPLGVDTNVFRPAPESERKHWRTHLGIPAGAVCIGSFQKDGNGWKEGLEPKLIKGPDIFVNVVEKLSESIDVVCLLTGPSRGYVKKELEKRGISFIHRYPQEKKELCKFYNCLDLYLITSREEGGPLAIMESLACKIPLVATKVGMAPDIIKEGKNGFLVEVNSVEEIVRKAKDILNNTEIRKRLYANSRRSILYVDWKKLIPHYHEIYSQLNK